MSVPVHALKVVARIERKEATRPAAPRRRFRRRLAEVVREPFFQFVLLGFFIWAGSAYWSAHHNQYLIQVGPDDRQRIATNYYRQVGQFPTPNQLQQLIDLYVREEIYLREGIALNLDQDDEIVRRRIVQKYEFLQTDLAVSETPTPAQLQQWFEQKRSRYLLPERVAFNHVYYAVYQDGEVAAKARATKMLSKLRALNVSRAGDQGDPFPGPSDVSSLAPDEASRLFGESELANTLFTVPLDQWFGPYRSGYGWHLVYVTGKTPSALPPLEEIHDSVLADYQDEQRREMNERTFEKVRAQYTVRDEGAGSSITVPPSHAPPGLSAE